MKEVDGVKVGFIGMTLEGTRAVTGASGVASVDFLDEVKTANRAAADLSSRGVQAIVVLLYEGGIQGGSVGQCTGMSGPVLSIAQNLDARIDAVITGHTHQPYVCHIPDPAGIDRLVTSASSFGRLVTETRLPIDRRTGRLFEGAKRVTISSPVPARRTLSRPRTSTTGPPSLDRG